MVRSPAMRLIRELPLVASLLVSAGALFFGGGAADGSLPWLGALVLAASVALVATRGLYALQPDFETPDRLAEAFHARVERTVDELAQLLQVRSGKTSS